MSSEQIPELPTALRAALRAYPASSRSQHAVELTAIFAQATSGAGHAVVLREALDIAVQGLRLRVGLGSDGRGGPIVASAAPLATAAAAGAGIGYLLGIVFPRHIGTPSGVSAIMFADEVGAVTLWLGVLGLILFGRWSAARTVAAVGMLAQVPLVVAAIPSLQEGEFLHALSVGLLPSAGIWLLLIAAPRDLLGSVRRDLPLIAGVFAVGVLPELLFGLLGAPATGVAATAALWILLLLALLVVLPFLRQGRTTAAALVLAAVVVLVRLGGSFGPAIGLLAATAALALGWQRNRKRAHS